MLQLPVFIEGIRSLNSEHGARSAEREHDGPTASRARQYDVLQRVQVHRTRTVMRVDGLLLTLIIASLHCAGQDVLQVFLLPAATVQNHGY